MGLLSMSWPSEAIPLIAPAQFFKKLNGRKIAEALPYKSDLIEQIREGEVRAAVSEITVEIISKKVAELNLEISRALSGLSEKMTHEVQLLGSLKEAVAIESKEIQRLHGIDVAATGVDQIS